MSRQKLQSINTSNNDPDELQKIGFGGSCHWCTEAIFLSVKGVTGVEQGWISSLEAPTRFSEAVLVSFDAEIVSIKTLVTIHLHTHSSTSSHHMRDKYRSAVYTFGAAQQTFVASVIKSLQHEFANPIITEVLEFGTFKINKPEYLNYYYSAPEKPFCQNMVNPKLLKLLNQFSTAVDHDKLAHLLPK